MLEFKRIRFWLIVFSLQMLLAVGIPTGLMLMLPSQELSVSLELPGLVFDNLSPDKAKEAINAFYDAIAQEGEIVLESEGKRMRIPYSSFELQIDIERVLERIEKGQYGNRFFQLIGKVGADPGMAKPELYMNEARFRDVFTDAKDFFHIEPGNAELIFAQGTLSVTPQKDGRELDIDKALQYIQKQLRTNPTVEMVLSQSMTPELFIVTEPEITTKQLQSYSQLYPIATGRVPSEKAEAFRLLTQNVQNVIIKPDEIFSFREKITPVLDPLQEHLASAVYQAVLPVEAIKIIGRETSNQPIPGIEPGLEVSLENTKDLQYKNTSKTELILLFEICDSGIWNAALAGKPGLRYGAIKTEPTKIAPSTIYSQDSSLPENWEEVKEPGKEGLLVKVYRIADEQYIKLYEDVYQPVHKIIAIGTGIKKEDIVRK